MKHTYSEEEKEKICQIVFEYLIKHDASCGEVIAQCDDASIDAVELACELAEVKDVTCFEN